MAACPPSIGSAMDRLRLSPGGSPMDDDAGEVEGAAGEEPVAAAPNPTSSDEDQEGGVRKRSEGGERLTRKRRREEGELVREEVACEVCGTVRLVSDKELQTEMGRRGCCTMRKTEKLEGGRRSGKNPDVGDKWEGAGDKFRVVRVPVEELTREKRRTAERKAMGKLKRKTKTQRRKEGKEKRESQRMEVDEEPVAAASTPSTSKEKKKGEEKKKKDGVSPALQKRADEEKKMMEGKDEEEKE